MLFNVLLLNYNRTFDLLQYNNADCFSISFIEIVVRPYEDTKAGQENLHVEENFPSSCESTIIIIFFEL